MKHILFAVSLVAILGMAQTVVAESRYFYGGDGNISIRSGKSGAAFSGQYRNADGNYIPAALDKINKTFGAPPDTIEPRFIEFLDYLQDAMKGGTMTVMSGYRSLSYNKSLRDNGSLAGKASMHQYGMAADIRMKGVHPEKIWHFVRELEYGGVGYYHGANAHVDVGPARFWDETTSKVGTDHADDNKLITLIPDKDVYYPGEELRLRFIRMTAYPIGVDMDFALERQRGDTWKKHTAFSPRFATAVQGTCPSFSNIDDMNRISWMLPSELKPGRYRIRASFCDKQWEAMPDAITSYEFEIRETKE